MYRVEWHGDGVINKHGTYNTKEEAYQSILDWWELNKFKPPYVRIYGDPDVTIDYGYHTCFYKLIKTEE